MKARLSNPKSDRKSRSQSDDAALVQVAIQKIRMHYRDQSFALRPARLSAILAMAALLRLAEKKHDGQGAAFAGLDRDDAAKAFLKAALALTESIHPAGR